MFVHGEGARGTQGGYIADWSKMSGCATHTRKKGLRVMKIDRTSLREGSRTLKQGVGGISCCRDVFYPPAGKHEAALSTMVSAQLSGLDTRPRNDMHSELEQLSPVEC